MDVKARRKELDTTFSWHEWTKDMELASIVIRLNDDGNLCGWITIRSHAGIWKG